MPQSLRTLVAAALNIDSTAVSEDSGLDVTPNWDSLRHVILITEIERTFDIEFELDTIGQATSVRRIRKLLSEKGVKTD